MEIKLDFSIIPSTPKTIKISDDSSWEWAEELDAFLSIIPPGSIKCITIPFEKNTVNTITSDILNLGCDVELKDGIYEINLLSGYEDINLKKYYLKTDRFERNTSIMIIEANESGDFDDKYIITFSKINWYLSLAKAYTKEGNVKKAEKAFQSAKTLFKSTNCKGCK